mgnify:FL=1
MQHVKHAAQINPLSLFHVPRYKTNALLTFVPYTVRTGILVPNCKRGTRDVAVPMEEYPECLINLRTITSACIADAWV